MQSALYRITGIPAVRVCCLLSLVLLTWICYAKAHFYRDPGSRFYDGSRAFERHYSAHREMEAQNYLRAIESQDRTDRSLKMDANPLMYATFLSVVRPGVNQSYLELSLASALDKLTSEERDALNLQVFIPSTRPQEHDVFHKPWLRKIVDNIHTYESVLSPADLDHARDVELAQDGDKKQPYDYALALRQDDRINAVNAKYIAIFEDDVVFADGWLARSLLGLRDVEKQMKSSHREGKWLYLRLFNQERSTGWASKAIGGNHALEISLCIVVGLLFILTVARRVSRTVRSSIDMWSVVVGVLFVPIFVNLFFQCGKASLLPPSPGVREESFGCCSQALIFNREHVNGLADYITLHGHEGHHYDMLTKAYAIQFGLARWTLHPTITQHVGVRSSVLRTASENGRVWSMAFEDLDPLRLAREHLRDVGRLFN